MSALARRIAAVGGVGHLPWAPGTWASLLTLPLASAMRDVQLVPFVGGWLLLGLIGAWAAQRAEQTTGLTDPGWIVLDEVVGTLVAVTFVDRSNWLQLGWAFVLFRAFDMLKPWPVRALERRVPGGAGVMLDDVAAGACAALVLAWLF